MSAFLLVVIMICIAGVIKTANLTLVFPLLFAIYLLIDNEKKGKSDSSIDALFGLLFFLGLFGVIVKVLKPIFS